MAGVLPPRNRTLYTHISHPDRQIHLDFGTGKLWPIFYIPFIFTPIMVSDIFVFQKGFFSSGFFIIIIRECASTPYVGMAEVLPSQ